MVFQTPKYGTDMYKENFFLQNIGIETISQNLQLFLLKLQMIVMLSLGTYFPQAQVLVHVYDYQR